MKSTIAILVSLFLIGCTNDDKSIELIERYTHLEKAMQEMKYEIHHLKNKNESPECVIFMRAVDSHAIISHATIPIDGRYYVSSWDHMAPRINYYKSGTIIQMPQDIIRDTCPQFKEATKGIEK